MEDVDEFGEGCALLGNEEKVGARSATLENSSRSTWPRGSSPVDAERGLWSTLPSSGCGRVVVVVVVVVSVG
jgi:hypothetical protein